MIKEHSIFYNVVICYTCALLSAVNDKPDLIFKYLLHIRVKLCCMLVPALVQHVPKEQGRNHTYTTFSAWKREKQSKTREGRTCKQERYSKYFASGKAGIPPIRTAVLGTGRCFPLHYQELTVQMLDDGTVTERCIGLGLHGLGIGKLLFTN